MEKLPPAANSSDPRAWAEQSCKLVAAEGFYPDRRVLEATSGAHWGQDVPQQLVAAGHHLRESLDAALARR